MIFVYFLVGLLLNIPTADTVYLKDKYAKTMLRAATLRQKLLIYLLFRPVTVC